MSWGRQEGHEGITQRPLPAPGSSRERRPGWGYVWACVSGGGKMKPVRNHLQAPAFKMHTELSALPRTPTCSSPENILILIAFLLH